MIVSVAGATSRAGKTALAETLLRALPAAAAVKFTTTDDVFERCPRGTSCVVCDIDVPYRVLSDPTVLRQPGTDTDRLAAAGASRVLWAIARRSAAAAAWRAVRDALGDGGPVVVEGSTVVGLARPDLLVFVAHPLLPPERWKSGSEALIAAADLVVVHSPEGREPAPTVRAALERHVGRGRLCVADVRRSLGAWAPDLEARLEPRGAPAPAAPLHG